VFSLQFSDCIITSASVYDNQVAFQFLVFSRKDHSGNYEWDRPGADAYPLTRCPSCATVYVSHMMPSCALSLRAQIASRTYRSCLALSVDPKAIAERLKSKSKV